MDLHANNRVIEAAVMTWQLPGGVKRLALRGYPYDHVRQYANRFWKPVAEGIRKQATR